MAIYEVFTKRAGKDEFRHAGAIEAPSDELARILARESYLRRAEGSRFWLVPRDAIVLGDEEFVSPNADKPHRHHDGAAVADRRKAARMEDA